MNIIDLIATANRNLTRAKLRTLLTILAIFVGGFTLSLTIALNTGANQYLNRQIGNISVPGVFQVLQKTDTNPFAAAEIVEYNPEKKQNSVRDLLSGGFTTEDLQKVAKVEGVEVAKPFYNVTGEYITRDGGKKYVASDITENVYLNLDLSAGRLLKDEDKNSIVLPEGYVDLLGFATPGDALGKTITFAYKNTRQEVIEHTATIIGVMKKTFLTGNSLYASDDLVAEVAKAQGQSDKFLAGIVKFKDATNQTDEAVLKKRLQDAGNYTAQSLKERIGTVITIVSAITAGLSVVGIIALLAASFGIINTLLMSVYERTQEIGLMKALGMGRDKVFGLFAIEAILVGFWGSVVAVGLAALAASGINAYAEATFLKDFEGFTLLVIDPMGAASVVGLIMLIAFLAGTLPAIKASRLNPIDALRSE